MYFESGSCLLTLVLSLNTSLHAPQTPCSEITVCKFQDFSVIQILREINFGEPAPKSSKTVVCAIFWGS